MTAGPSGPAAGDDAGRPALVTSVSPDRAPRAFGLHPAIVALAVVAGLGVIGLSLAADRPAMGTARVTAVGPAPDRVTLQVVDGPTPVSTWFTWEGDPIPEVGDIVEVELGGRCGCLPHQPRPGLWGTLIDSFAPMAWLVAVAALVAWQRRGQLAAARAARRTLETGSSTGPVHLSPVLTGSGGRLHQWWAVWLEAEPTRPLGWVEISYEPAFDPTATFLMSGGDRVGSPVAFTSTDGRQLVLPATTLRDDPGPAHPCSALVVELLGWGPPPAPARSPEMVAAGEATARRMATMTVASGLLFLVALCAAFVLQDLPLLVRAFGPLAGWIGLRWVLLVRPSRVVYEPLGSVIRSSAGLSRRDAAWAARSLMMSGIAAPVAAGSSATGAGPPPPWPYAPYAPTGSGPTPVAEPFRDPFSSPLVGPHPGTEGSAGPSRPRPVPAGPTPRFPPPPS